MIYCGAQAKGFKHLCCQSPDRVDDEESGKLRTCSTRGGGGVGGATTKFSVTHLESTLPPKQTHKAGQEAANLFDYFLGHLATFQFGHLHLWHTRGGGGAVSHDLRPPVPFLSVPEDPSPLNVTYASLISHYRLASPRLLRDLITIKLTIFKPIIGLQTLIKAMHWF